MKKNFGQMEQGEGTKTDGARWKDQDRGCKDKVQRDSHNALED